MRTGLDAAGSGAAVDVLKGSFRNERLPRAERIVLAERVAFELLVQKNPAQIGMSGEADPVEVPHEALPPVGSLVHGRERGHLRVLARDADLQADLVVARE